MIRHRPAAQFGAPSTSPSQQQGGGAQTPQQQTGQQSGPGQMQQTAAAPQTRYTDWASI